MEIIFKKKPEFYRKNKQDVEEKSEQVGQNELVIKEFFSYVLKIFYHLQVGERKFEF